MKLYEHEGKAILTMGGIEVPRGDLWPNVHQLVQPVAIKAQLLEGGRGKRGGILFAEHAEEIEQLAERLLAGSDELPPAPAVLVEERLKPERELYLAFMVDRSSPTGINLLMQSVGGVDVEEHSGKAQRIPVPALMQRLPSYVIREAGAALELENNGQLEALLNSCLQLFIYHDCTLLEINPLAMLGDGRLVALDVRMEVDDAARFRHQEWPQRIDGTPFEVAARELGASASELDGDIAIVTSGAGLGMATLDMVHRAGGQARCVVDLGGMVFRPEDSVSQLMALVAGLQPRAILFNCFLQLASLERLTHELMAGLAGSASEATIIVRAAGPDAELVKPMLERGGAQVFHDIDAACRATVAAGAALSLGAGH